MTWPQSTLQGRPREASGSTSHTDVVGGVIAGDTQSGIVQLLGQTLRVYVATLTRAVG